MKRITVLGNFSGRNAGDNAILGNLLSDISREYSGVQFIVPTWSKDFITSNFGEYNVKPVGLKPWNLSLKIFGYPTYKSMTETDLILITDNLLFDKNFYNPLFNYLATIALFAPAARKRNIPIFPYNVSLGPVSTDIGRKALQKILDASPYVSIRDLQSRELLDNNKFRYNEVLEGADCAINTKVPEEERMDTICEKEQLFTNANGTFGFNINTYIDAWLQTGSGKLDRNLFLDKIAAALDEVIDSLAVDVLFVVTQVMDEKINREVIARMKNKNSAKMVCNAQYTYQEIAGLLARCGLHVGMRTHSLILASSVHCPIITLNCYPKSKGFVTTLGQQDWLIEVQSLEKEVLVGMIKAGWEKRAVLQEDLASHVMIEQKKALKAVSYVGLLLGI